MQMKKSTARIRALAGYSDDDDDAISKTNLERAKLLWQRTTVAPFQCEDRARHLHEELSETEDRLAKAWSALVCGRLAALGSNGASAERYLVEAIGYFRLVGDACGAALADCHLAFVLTESGGTTRANELLAHVQAEQHLFDPLSRAIIHSLAGACCWRQHDYSSAISHLFKEQQILQNAGFRARESITLSNIGVLLLELGELELAAKTCQHAWTLQLDQ
jgi:hypothetical protein